ncbi:MAG: heme ABC exporter ATP-binding protein CcmA [Aggregatilineales bacterium]
MIEVAGLVKTFGLRPVLRGLDLTIARGECLALLGPNGSGKTTLLRILSALSRPTAGRVTIGGWRLPDESAAVRAHLGVVGHMPLLYAELTAEENLRFFAQLYGVNTARVGVVLDRVGLTSRAHDRVGAFSRGMQQRLSIARALLHEPEVWLLDEPHTGLDVVGASLLDDLIAELRTAGRTLILTTHDFDRALALSDHVAILSRGKIVGLAERSTLDPASLGAWYATITNFGASALKLDVCLT